MGVPAETIQRRVSVSQYLHAEESAEQRHEFHDGEVLAMSGGTYEHSLIGANLIIALGRRLTGSPCRVLESNMRVRIARANRYLYPDASIVCHEPQFDPQDVKRTTIVNPRIIVEVLSDSTEAYDRGMKFNYYRELEALEEYVLVSQARPLIETFVRQNDKTWLFTTSAGLDGRVALRTVRLELPLAEVYAGVSFPAGNVPSTA